MSDSRVLQSLESQAYRRTFSDGTIDLFVGVSMMWIGAAWIQLSDYAGFAGVLPAVFVPVLMTARKRLVENRLGHVKWAEPRRNKQRSRMIGLFAAGMFMFLAAMIGFLVLDRSPESGALIAPIVPGLLAWLLADLSVTLGYLMEAWRFVLYAVALAVAGLVTALRDANPGWPLLACGAVVAVTGSTMLIRFMRSHAVPEET
jgi:hypothetical protein